MSLTWVFDLGTTYLKAVAFSAAGETRCVCRRPTPWQQSDSGRVEMPADAFRGTLVELVAEGRQRLGESFAQIDRVSFATQANTFTLLDESGEPVVPWISWTDRRAEDHPLPRIEDYAVTGVPAVSANLSAAKLVWLRAHRPKVWSRARRVAYLSDELTRWLTGGHVAAADVAGLTGLFDIHSHRWRRDVLRDLGLDAVRWPEPMRPGTSLGALQDRSADEIGLPRGAVFHVGCLDQYAAGYAAALPTAGGVCETTGTVLATVTAADAFVPSLQAAGIYQGPASTSGYFRMKFGHVSANLLAAYRQNHAADLDYTRLDLLAADPHDPGPHGRAVRDIYERVAEALQSQIEALRPQPAPTHLTCLGGGARSPLWKSIKSRRLGLPCRSLPTDEPTAWGVVRLIDRVGRGVAEPPARDFKASGEAD